MRVNKQVDPPALVRTTPDDRLRPIPHRAHADKELQKEVHVRAVHTSSVVVMSL